MYRNIFYPIPSLPSIYTPSNLFFFKTGGNDNTQLQVIPNTQEVQLPDEQPQDIETQLPDEQPQDIETQLPDTSHEEDEDEQKQKDDLYQIQSKEEKKKAKKDALLYFTTPNPKKFLTNASEEVMNILHNSLKELENYCDKSEFDEIDKIICERMHLLKGDIINIKINTPEIQRPKEEQKKSPDIKGVQKKVQELNELRKLGMQMNTPLGQPYQSPQFYPQGQPLQSPQFYPQEQLLQSPQGQPYQNPQDKFMGAVDSKVTDALQDLADSMDEEKGDELEDIYDM